jgi:hypothetical protein
MVNWRIITAHSFCFTWISLTIFFFYSEWATISTGRRFLWKVASASTPCESQEQWKRQYEYQYASQRQWATAHAGLHRPRPRSFIRQARCSEGRHWTQGQPAVKLCSAGASRSSTPEQLLGTGSIVSAACWLQLASTKSIIFTHQL